MLVWHAAVIVSVTHKWFLLEFHGELKNELDSREKTLGGPVIIYRLEEQRILGGISWFLGEEKGRISRNWELKREDHWRLWKDSEGGTTQNCLENADMHGGGGGQTLWNVIRGDHFSEVTFKRGIG